MVTFEEKTNYPFSDRIEFLYKTAKPEKFPLYLRIPTWCKQASIKINNQELMYVKGGEIAALDREWHAGDVVVLELPMEIRLSRWYENSLGIERGPLVYALRMDEQWSEKTSPDRDDTYWEVRPGSPWNYGIPNTCIDSMNFQVEVGSKLEAMPWNLQNAPIQIKTKGQQIPYWGLYENSAGKIPWSPYPYHDLGTPIENITLIPYGCTTLRIAEFPVVVVK
jgi:DUF1680 family protein